VRLGGAARVSCVVGLAVSIGLTGCRPPRPARLPLERPPTAESVRTGLARVPAPPGVEGSGALQVTLLGRKLPGVTARFCGAPDSGRVTLRPGILSPVLALWASGTDWRVGLPPRHVVVIGDAVGPDEIRLARLLWYIVCPRDLAADLTAATCRASDEGWILRGRLGDLGAWVRAVELQLDPSGEGIGRWSLWLATGSSAFSVAYDRPLLVATTGTAISFVAPPLGARGILTLNQFRISSTQQIVRPSVPPGWAILPADSLLRFLEGFSPAGE